MASEESNMQEAHGEMQELNEWHLYLLYDRSRSLSCQEAVGLATATVDSMELLREYPALASHRLYDADDDDDEPLYSLEFLVYNSFGKKLLDFGIICEALASSSTLCRLNLKTIRVSAQEATDYSCNARASPPRTKHDVVQPRSSQWLQPVYVTIGWGNVTSFSLCGLR